LLGSFTSPRSKGIPDLTNEQVEALNAMHFVAEEHGVTIKLEKGDVMFWNNLGLLHCRNGFTDSAEHKRHLVRLWLHSENNAWSIPQELRGAWQDSYIHAGRQQYWPIEPIIDREYVSTQQRASGHA
jgi:Taurine catabolism dioxygenase TauD, TfdA family